MGKSKDKKKKGLGMEKTLAKTEKKIQKNIQKELDEIGEENIEDIIAALNEKEKLNNQVKEETLPVGQAPSARGGATFSLLPEKDELVLFGGEYYDGHKVFMYNDLFVYNIKKNQWTLIKAPNGPPPRCSHQAVVVSRNAGELWVFGGEYSSPSQSQFYHYNDMWVFQFQTKQWTKITGKNSPSARSGHRMAVLKKHIVLFGGFYDNNRDCRFYNDTYAFNLETNQWDEVKFAGLGDQVPSPRSACQMSVNNKTNSIVIYGGFSKEKLKKEREKAVTHTDMFVLTNEIKKEKLEWSWKKVKQGGLKPSERLSSSTVTLLDDTALVFGGVYDPPEDDDADDESESASSFYNDMYKLDLTSFKWSHITLRGKKDPTTKPSKKSLSPTSANKDTTEKIDEQSDTEELNESMNDVDISLNESEERNKEHVDGAFTLTYSTKNPIVESKPQQSANSGDTVTLNEPVFVPSPRRSAYLQCHKGILYMFGGKFEDASDKEFTFNDLYCLNTKKMDEWKMLIEDKNVKSTDLNKSKIDDSGDESKDEDEDDSDDDSSDMEIDAPPVLADETLEAYFKRTDELWQGEAVSEFPNEKSKKILNKMAFELCSLFFENLKASGEKNGAATASS